jgi:N6-L-threonylcarbamoyladenine synthase
MKILAFETSCDDTAVAIVEDGTKVLSSIKVSQIEHNEFGGVVPEIAARLHAENWKGAYEKCLSVAGLRIEEIDFLAVTYGPGLQTSLISGTTAASFLSLLHQKPVIRVHHTLGHLCSIFLDREMASFQFPVLSLAVSGGHTEFYLQRSPIDIDRLGGALDDAAGEAFDKVAKMLGLGYPGGPFVSQWALKGDRKAIAFPRVYLSKISMDFSFSGVKASVYREVEKYKTEHGNNFSEEFIANVCASFEQCVADTFVKKVSRALVRYPEVMAVQLSGGVSANTYLRESLEKLLGAQKKKLLVPAQFPYCTDNAAMIGSAAYFLHQKNPDIAKIQYVTSFPRLTLLETL